LGKEASTFQILSHQNPPKTKLKPLQKKQTEVGGEAIQCFAPMECVHQISFQLDGPMVQDVTGKKKS
jgi:hypothetical protein